MKVWLMSLWTSMKAAVLMSLFLANLNSDNSFLARKHLEYHLQNRIAYDGLFAEVI